MAKIAVGIDLGTTFSSIAAYENNNVEVLVDNNGNRAMASFVTFSVAVGKIAKKNIMVDSSCRVYGE